MTGIDGSQAAQITRALEAAGRDMTTLHVRENALLSAVAAYPVVRSLRTETDFPHGLRIIVNAYEPVAAVRAGGGLTAVAADGTLLRGSATRDLPVVAIRATARRRRASRRGERSARVRLLAAAPRALRGRVARVYRGPRGLTTTMDNGPKLYFGGAARGPTRSGGRRRRCWPAAPRAAPRTSTCGSRSARWRADCSREARETQPPL